MKSNYKLLFLILLCVSASASAQLITFEEEVPKNINNSDDSNVSLSSLYYKEGNKSLKWNFSPNSVLCVQEEIPFIADKNNGITLWIYNEVPHQDSIRFEFYSPSGHVSHHFGFRLYSAGWRACWISFEHMQGDKIEKEIAGYYIIAPNRKGRVFLDRLTFPVKKINDRTTPDLQMPTNNSLSYRDLWHWCRVWQWEQYQYDIPLSKKLTAQEKQDLAVVESRLTDALDLKKAPKESIAKAYLVFNKANIQSSSKGFTGAPIVAPDELNRQKGEMSWNDIETMLSGFAYDAHYNRSAESLENYFIVWNYAIDQGFAFGSGMGTNHHYGYQIRKIYTTAWLMRDAIWRSPNKGNILSTLSFWSALQETRIPFQYGRDELLDSWHTLLMAKVVSALMLVDERERVRSIKGLSRWLSGSLLYSPGTIGGIKVDGTTFHHGGFYPAYTTGVLAMVGQYISFTNRTSYELDEDARQALKLAFIAMRNYCNRYEWGIGISGRHPFRGSMSDEDVEAFGFLALSGDLSGEGKLFDHHLASDYLRLSRRDTPLVNYFREQGIRSASAPQGFFVYNYGSAGVFRRSDWMVTLKGYNTDVWGAEIYKNDNRYGRYQSYGSVQIMGYPSREASGYDENGWDWNRLPGTTAIHLPFELLDSPLPETTMAHSKENFSGSSSLEGINGMFAMKLMERNLKNFTSDFVARKSVFCFDNRMICLGTGISNSNANFPTETTLFQSTFRNNQTPIYIDGVQKSESFHLQLNAENSHWVQDGYNNHYFVKEGEIHVQIAMQGSRHEKTRAKTEGAFASMYINHGKAPRNSGYEYMVLIHPTTEQLKATRQESDYLVLQKDSTAHVVMDKATTITAYAVFDTYTPRNDSVFLAIPAETMVMRKSVGNRGVLFSVCDPNLNIAEKAYTTQEVSRSIEKTFILKGTWCVSAFDKRINLTTGNGRTMLTVTCRHGQPIEFTLLNGVE